LQVLAEYYGAQDAGTAPDANSIDPQEQRLAALEAQQAEIAQQALIAEIEDTVEMLREEYGDVDRDELLQYAVDNEIPNLRAALLDMREEQAKQQRIEERNRQVIARKAGTVTAGRSRVGNDAIGREPGPINTVGDALAEAMQELGLDHIPSF
jgi:multidrug efflux pump subunit AcrA (membrane-fusion protein)